MKQLLSIVLLFCIVIAASAETRVMGWEESYTVLGMYGVGTPPIIETVETSPDPVHGGFKSLKLVDNAPSGTPSVYLAWVKGLTDGDEVTACVWRYDDTPATAPSGRIWGHWNDDPGDVNGYAGSAGGNADYGLGLGWDETCYTWTVADGHTGIVIEFRTYSLSGDTVWIDDFTITAPATATIELPGSDVMIDRESWSVIKGLYR